MFSTEILETEAIITDKFSEKVNNQKKDNKVVFTITYCPVFYDIRNILEEMEVIFTLDYRHKKVFPEVTMIGFKDNKSLQDLLVRSKTPDIDQISR